MHVHTTLSISKLSCLNGRHERFTLKTTHLSTVNGLELTSPRAAKEHVVLQVRSKRSIQTKKDRLTRTVFYFLAKEGSCYCGSSCSALCSALRRLHEAQS